MLSKIKILILFLVCAFLIFACGPGAKKSQSVLDTPEHHVSNGKKLLRVGKIDAAFKEFERAKELKPKFSPAYVGLGLVYSKKGDFDKALSMIKKADGLSDNDSEEYYVLTGFMRVYTDGMESVDKDWLEEVADYHEKAVKILPKNTPAYYFMGIAYKKSYNFRKAEDQLKEVIELNGDYYKEASREYEIINKIRLSMPKTGIGKKIALMGEISRADMAALLVEELKIEKLMKRKKAFNTSYRTNTAMEKESRDKIPPATDIDNHVLKVDIDRVIELGISGLQPYPDHTFKPGVKVIRSELAMIIADILEKISGDRGLSTRFIGNSSPFPDIRNDLPYFNAVMICTTRGIMQIKDKATGEFDPQGTISGAEALYALHQLKVQLKR